MGDFETGQQALLSLINELVPLGTLSDVTLTAPADNEILAFDNGSGLWINQTPDEADIIDKTTTQTMTGKTLDSFLNTNHADTVHIQIRNETGVTITKGSVVHISGFSVPQDLPLIALADSDSAATMPAVGIVTDDISDNTNGDVTIAGVLDGVVTTGLTNGATIYVNGTPGVFTDVKPTGTGLIQNIGTVLKVGGAGVGRIKITSMDRTNDLPNIPDGEIWIGNASAVPTPVIMSGDILISNTGVTSINTGVIVDGDIAVHTSTKITITAKGQLNSSIIYGDQNNSLGAFYVDIDDIAVPANPGASIRRLFVNTATGELSVRTSAGATVSLEAVGAGEANTHSSLGGGSFALTAATPKTGVNLNLISISNGNGMNAALATDVLTLAVASTVVQTDQANTYGDFLQTFKDNQLKINSPDDADGVIFVNSNQTADRNLIIPILTANRDIVVTGEASQIVIGTEVTGASTALTDTADIAYLNTINTFLSIQTFNANVIHAARNQEDKGSDVVSASTITLGGDGNFFDITGTTTINEILGTNWQAGSEISLQFDAILTITNNSGGTNDILTADGANITTAAGFVLGLRFNGTDWIEIFRNTVGGAGANYAIIGFAGLNLTAANTYYAGLGTPGSSWDTTEANFTNDADFAGEFNTFHFNVKSNSKNTSSTLTFRIAGVDKGTLTIGSSATGEFESVANTDAIAINDNLNFKIIATGSGTITGWTGYIRVKIDSVE